MYVCYECSFVSEEIYMKDCDQIVWLFLSKKKKNCDYFKIQSQWLCLHRLRLFCTGCDKKQ